MADIYITNAITNASTTATWWTTASTTTVTSAATWGTWTYNNNPWSTGTQAGVGAPYQPDARERRRLAARKRARERARVIAERLLVENLDEAQAEAYRRRKAFEVIGSDGERYRISEGLVQGLTRLRRSRPTSYCIHPPFGYPEPDTMLAKKLLLEADAEEFLRIANAS